MKTINGILSVFIFLLHSNLFAAEIQVDWVKSVNGKYIIFNAYKKSDEHVTSKDVVALLIEVDPSKISRYKSTQFKKGDHWYSEGADCNYPFYAYRESLSFITKIGFTPENIVSFRKSNKHDDKNACTKAISKGLWNRFIKLFIESESKNIEIGDNTVTFKKLEANKYERHQKEIKQIFKDKKTANPVLPHFKEGKAVVIKVGDNEVYIDNTNTDQIIDFGEITEGMGDSKSVILQNIGECTVDLKITINDKKSGFTSSAEELSIGQDSRHTISFLPATYDKNNIDNNIKETKITYQDSANSDYKIIVTLKAKIKQMSSICIVDANGTQKSEITIDFEDTPVGRESQQQSVTLKNLGTDAIDLKMAQGSGYGANFMIEVDGEDNVDVFSIEANKTKSVNIKFAPKDYEPSKNDVTVVLEYENASANNNKVSITLKGRILPPSGILSHIRSVFGNLSLPPLPLLLLFIALALLAVLIIILFLWTISPRSSEDLIDRLCAMFTRKTSSKKIREYQKVEAPHKPVNSQSGITNIIGRLEYLERSSNLHKDKNMNLSDIIKELKDFKGSPDNYVKYFQTDFGIDIHNKEDLDRFKVEYKTSQNTINEIHKKLNIRDISKLFKELETIQKQAEDVRDFKVKAGTQIAERYGEKFEKPADMIPHYIQARDNLSKIESDLSQFKKNLSRIFIDSSDEFDRADGLKPEEISTLIQTYLAEMKQRHKDEIDQSNRDRQQAEEQLDQSKQEKRVIMENLDPILNFFEVEVDQLPQTFQDHAEYVQDKDIYLPSYMQNYETLLHYMFDNISEIYEKAHPDSKFRDLFKSVMYGERNNAGLKLAIDRMGNKTNRDKLLEDLEIGRYTELRHMEKKDFFEKHLKRNFMSSVLHSFMRIYLYRHIDYENLNLADHYRNDGINIELLDEVCGYMKGSLRMNFGIQLSPIRLFRDHFDREKHETGSARSPLERMLAEYKEAQHNLERDIIYDIISVGIMSEELDLHIKSKVIVKV